MVANRSDTRGQVLGLLNWLAKLWIAGALALASLISLNILGILFGFNVFNENAPFVELIHQNPVFSVIVTIVYVASIFFARVIVRNANSKVGGAQSRSVLVALSLAVVSTALFLLLVATVLFQPAWCHGSPFCPITYHPNGIHDGAMEMYFTAYQSQFYVIAGNPDSYNLDALPDQRIGAVVSGPTPAKATPCNIFIGVHSLRDSGYDILIQQVYVVILDVPALTSHLNVWQPGSNLVYRGNPYQVMYRGELQGNALRAQYLTAPAGLVQLMPQEADALDLQLSSLVPADVKFQVKIVYRMANEGELHTLILPQVFEVDFSTHANWHPYTLVNGRLTPTTP
jgi:hypothetical protein